MEKKKSVIAVPPIGNDMKQENVAENKCWHIDRDMIGYKLHFFLLCGGVGAVSPFTSVYVQKELRISATAFGTVIVALQISRLLLIPLIGFIVDYFNKLKTALFILTVSQAVLFSAFFCLPIIPLIALNHVTTQRTNGSINGSCVCYLCLKKKEFSDTQVGGTKFLNVNNNNSLCEHNVTNITFNCNAINNENVSSSCYFNGQLSELKEFDSIPDEMHGNRTVQFPLLCSPCISDTNIPHSLNIPSCILCYNHSSSCYNASKYMEFNSIPDAYGNRTVQSSQPCSTCIKRINMTFNASHIPNRILCCDNSSSCYNASTFEIPTKEPQRLNDFYSYEFWLFVFVFIVMFVCMSALFVLSETACCESVQKTGADFGQQRMFGPFGYGSMACLSGILSNYTNNYVCTSLVLVVMSVVMLWNISRLDFEKPNYSNTFFKDLGDTFRSRDFIAFEVGVLINGIGMGAIGYYLVWFLFTIGGDNLLFGCVHLVQNFLGIAPFMFVSGWMIRKFGNFHISTLSLLSYCLRFLYLSFLQNPWYALMMEWNHGISYGANYINLAAFAKMNAKPGTEATMQSILFMTFESLGTGIGNIATGVGIDYFGGHRTFFYGGIFYGCSTLVSFSYTLLFQETGSCFTKKSKTYVTNL